MWIRIISNFRYGHNKEGTTYRNRFLFQNRLLRRRSNETNTIRKAYKDTSLMRSNTFGWRARFRDVKESVEDNERSDIKPNRRKSHSYSEPAESRLRKLSKSEN